MPSTTSRLSPIRPMRPDDISRLVGVFHQAYAPRERGDMRSAAELSAGQRAEAEAYLRKFYDFDPACSFVALDHGESAGYDLVHGGSDMVGQNTDNAHDSGEVLVGAVLAYSYAKRGQSIVFLQDLFVLPRLRHHGIARKLVAAVRDSFAERPRMNVVPLVKADTRILNFYNSLGFDKETVFSFFEE